MRICKVELCSRQHIAQGYCTLHYKRVQKSGRAGSAGEQRRSFLTKRLQTMPNHRLTHCTHELYKTWLMMTARCYSVNHTAYKDYGGRGIQVCKRWTSDIEWCGFCAFVQDMRDRPEGYTLDRIDNNGNYEPLNCRWADRTTQNRNSRLRKTNQSGAAGVSWDKYKAKWVAQIYVGDRKVMLGRSKDLESAIKIRKTAELKYR